MLVLTMYSCTARRRHRRDAQWHRAATDADISMSTHSALTGDRMGIKRPPPAVEDSKQANGKMEEELAAEQSALCYIHAEE